MYRTILFMAVCSFFVLTGCVQENRINQAEDMNGQRLITGEGGRFYERNLESERYNTNQNPNFIDLTENRPDYGDDQAKVQEIIEVHSDLDPGPVYITGNTIRTTAYPNKKLSKEEKQKVERQLKRDFARAIPRYHVVLTIENRE